jgi:hypothetical protein
MTHLKKQMSRFPGYAITPDGVIWSRKRSKEWRPLSPSKSSRYDQVTMFIKGKTIYKKVHILVLEEFVGPKPSNIHQACHNDGDSFNNNVTNLKWGTPSDNYQDRHGHGTNNTGMRNGRAVLTDKQVLEIRDRLLRGARQTDLGREYGVSQVTISMIKLRKKWGHL